jgi:hypothetical protein
VGTVEKLDMGAILSQLERAEMPAHMRPMVRALVPTLRRMATADPQGTRRALVGMVRVLVAAADIRREEVGL